MQNLVLTIYVLQFIESFSCIVTDIESRKLLQHQSDIPWKHPLIYKGYHGYLHTPPNLSLGSASEVQGIANLTCSSHISQL